MKQTYRCPECKGLLNPNVKIILRAAQGGQRGLVLFSPQPGNYDAILPEDLVLRNGDVVDFGCPLCSADLTSKRNAKVAEITFRSPGGHEGVVLFSRTYGEHATFFITDEDVRSYGEHATDEGFNFWGAGPDRR